MRTEDSLISPDKRPLSKQFLKDELTRMGLAPGDLVLMHASMSQLGWIIGGAQTLLAAVFEVLGETGTLVMPGFSSHLSDPTDWNSPPVPASWVSEIRDNMPLFDADLTPTRGIGQVAEALRALPATLRSPHPNDSFLAHGPKASELVQTHALERSLGRNSPLGRLRDKGAQVLLLGAAYDNCTCFHLAEEDLPGVEPELVKYPVSRKNHVTEWQSVLQIPTFEEHFALLGGEFEATSGLVSLGFENAAKLFDMSEAVEFARGWLIQAAQEGRLST